jgi:hypothetical protein
MKKIIVCFLSILIAVKLLTSMAFAQYQSLDIPTPTPKIDYSLPFPGILPTHPLYPLKLLRDKILLLTTRDPMKKSEYLLIFADKNLAMGEILAQEGNRSEALETYLHAEENLNASLDRLAQSKSDGVFPPGPLSKRELSYKKHKEVIEDFLSGHMDPSFKEEGAHIIDLNKKALLKIENLRGSQI